MKCIALFITIACMSMGLQAQSFVVGGNEQIKPFEPLVKKVLADAGITAAFSFVPQARLIKSMEDGTFQGGFFMSDAALATMPGAVKIPVVLSRIDTVAVCLDPAIKITGTADLTRYRVGIVRGDKSQEAVSKGLKLTEATDAPTQFRMLAGKRFDVAITSRTLLPSLVKYLDAAPYYVQEPPLSSIPLYFILSRTGVMHKDAITKAFKTAVDNGTWDRDINAMIKSAFQ